MRVTKSARSMRKDNFPTFERPPLVETVIGVQFDQIPNLTSAHLGWYWREVLGKSWVRALETVPLQDQFENFGEQTRRLPFPGLTAKMLSSLPSPRIQFMTEADDRVIQIQNTKFLYNWRKREAVYPRFKDLYPEFIGELDRFREFLKSASLGDATFNQWEITYVNHIEKGEIWNTPEDWHKILPRLFPAPRKSSGIRLERESGEISFEVTPERGRLHIQIVSGKSLESGDEILELNLTARGPIVRNNPTLGLDSGIELGHRVLVEAFAGMASETALKAWGKKDP
jgi:uncharacterized protein (TIGR04255 family)